MLEIIGVILGMIGALAAVWYFYDRLYPLRRLTWRFAEKTARKFADDMTASDFSPTLIIGIGRGGAIMGALISGCLGHRPLVVIDRKYIWEKGDRLDDIISRVDIPDHLLKIVLIVSGEVHSGNTMKLYCEYFRKIGAEHVCRATLFFEKGATVSVEYKGLESTKKNILMPWMFSTRYRRQDRYPLRSELSRERESP